MRFVPDHTLNILGEEEFTARMGAIEESLASCRTTGQFATFDDQPIYYEYYLAENSRGAIVMVHGLSEFTRKYDEMAWYFLNQGYHVFLYDQRGHGLSGRQVDRLDVIHVDRFEDYAADLAQFIAEIVRPTAAGLPLYLYGHSMGGAVVCMYLAQSGDTVHKAVLSSPMIAPTTGSIPSPFARVMTGLDGRRRGNKSLFKYAKEFNPHPSYERSSDISRSRFERNLGLRVVDPHYQSTPLTTGWVYNSLCVKRQLLSRRVTRRIHTPLLLLSAEKDTVVHNTAQAAFARRCRVCRMHTIPGAKHSMYTGNEAIMREYMEQILAFYAE